MMIPIAWLVEPQPSAAAAIVRLGRAGVNREKFQSRMLTVPHRSSTVVRKEIVLPSARSKMHRTIQVRVRLL